MHTIEGPKIMTNTFLTPGRKKVGLYCLVILFSGLVYVSQYWSPSSYGLILNRIGVADSGLVFGEPRPIRSDEWGVVTPLTQATVNNQFHRINNTSLYKEDLRINYGLPIFDWGLIFKPTMWSYLVTSPAHAYSFHWFAILALFLVGYSILFSKFGFTDFQSIFFSFALYFTGFTQFWWNEKGPIFAFFPWVILTLLLPTSFFVRLLLFYWVFASWLITNFYPPVFLSLAFVGALMIGALERSWLRPGRLVALGATGIAAAATVVCYLKDYLIKTSQTSYPGQRAIGGGSVSWKQWLSQLFPAGTFDWSYESVIGLNTCEVGVIGSGLTLMLLCFLDYRNLRTKYGHNSQDRTKILILGVGLLLMTGWLLLPLPPWAGLPFLWNNVQPARMLFASGLLLMLIAAIVGNEVGVLVTAKRLCAFTALFILGWVKLKNISLPLDPRLIMSRSNDLVLLPALFTCLIIGQRFGIPRFNQLVTASGVASAIILFGFNPIQSSKDFFKHHDTGFIRLIAQEYQPSRGCVAFAGMPGATLNGLGFASVSHVTAVPALDFWRQRYPQMLEADFLKIFNRYSHISLTEGLAPTVLAADNVGLPLKDFTSPREQIPSKYNEPRVAFWLEAGQPVTGTLSITNPGDISVADIFIGNGRDSADGALLLKLCSSQHCSASTRRLSDSIDNEFLRFRLATPLTVRSNEIVNYELEWQGGSHPVALWTYPQPTPGPVTFQVGQRLLSSTPRFRLEYDSKIQ